MGVYGKLLTVQNELKAPKNQWNDFGKYHYRSCEDILEAAKPILKKHNCMLFISDRPELVGSLNYITARAMFVDCETDESVVATASAREELTKKGMDAAQITGSTSSYARKYALNGLFCIDDSKDPDTNENKNESVGRAKRESKKTESKPAGSAGETIGSVDISVLRDYFADNGISEEKILKKYAYKSLEEMPQRIFTNVTNPNNLNYFQQKCGVDA